MARKIRLKKIKNKFMTYILPTLFILSSVLLCGADDKKSQMLKLSAKADPPGQMKFDQSVIKAKAGTPIELTFKNPDLLQHNVLILKPGTKDKVGALADAMLTDPDALKKHYVPTSTDILYSSKLVNPGASETLKFTIKEAGEYPIICTFPGHWRLMFAVLKVEK